MGLTPQARQPRAALSPGHWEGHSGYGALGLGAPTLCRPCLPT